MITTRTFTIIKPDAFKSGYSGLILNEIIQSGFKITALKLIHLTEEKAAEFYAIHKERPFFQELITFMCSGPIIVAVLEKENAVEAFRKLIGATDPVKAEPNTIRKKYAKNVGENAIHGSDSSENVQVESRFFFSDKEIFSY